MEIVFPQNNEQEFVEIAIKLGYKELCFAYREEQLPKEVPKTNKLVIKTAIINPKNPPKARKKAEFLIADENARGAFESKEIDIVFGLESKAGKDFARQRNSGLNQVLCEIANKKNKVYGFNFRDILASKNRALIIGRMMQNLMLCKKYNVRAIIFSGAKEPYEMKNYKDLKSFFELVKRI